MIAKSMSVNSLVRLIAISVRLVKNIRAFASSVALRSVVGDHVRTRALLHKSKLSGFTEHAAREDWKIETPVGDYEVFRAWKVINGKKQWAFVYDRNRGDHFTTHGLAVGIANRFIHRDELREGQP